MEDEELLQSTVMRAAQRPPTIFYVPLSVFILEAVVGLVLFRVFHLWSLIFTPIHFWFVVQTESDFNWVKVLWINLMHHTLFVPNKGLAGKDVVTFNPAPIKARSSDYESLR